jgi:RNA polymerase primary sigma factor
MISDTYTGLEFAVEAPQQNNGHRFSKRKVETYLETRILHSTFGEEHVTLSDYSSYVYSKKYAGLARKLERKGIFYLDEILHRGDLSIDDILAKCRAACYTAINVLSGTKGNNSNPVTLTREEEQLLFMRFNFAKYMFNQELQKTPKYWQLKKRSLNYLARIIDETREYVTVVNLGLVPKMLRGKGIRSADWSGYVSDGNMALRRAAEGFDITRGYKFSTYACRAIFKEFCRTQEKNAKYTGHNTPYDSSKDFTGKEIYKDLKKAENEAEYLNLMMEALSGSPDLLNDVERRVINARFDLSRIRGEGMTLEEVGRLIGVTKERVRQIQNEAFRKLRERIISSVS